MLARRGAITADDLWRVMPEDSVEVLLHRLSTAWRDEVAKGGAGTPSLTRAYIRAYGCKYVAWGLVAVVRVAAVLAQTQFLAALLDELGAPSDTSGRAAYLYALGLTLALATSMLAHHAYFFAMWRFGARWRMAGTAMLYDKLLRVRSDAVSSDGGNVIPLASADIEKMQKAAQYLPFLVVGPLEAGIIVWLLWREVGVACFTGLGALVLIVAFQGVLSYFFGGLRHATAVATDERVRLTQQVVTGVRVLKASGWEAPFLRRVIGVRDVEVSKLRAVAWLRGVNEGVFWATNVILCVAVFLPFYAMGGVFTARRVFVSFTLFNLLQVDATKFLQLAAESIAELTITMKRLERFLTLPETEVSAPPATSMGDGAHTSVMMPTSPSPSPSPLAAVGGDDGAVAGADTTVDVVQLRDVTCRWQQETSALAVQGAAGSPPCTLSHVSLSVRRGELAAIVGAVGSGKTSLLMTLLRELVPLSGMVRTPARVVYVSQSPWILSGTIRDNITLGLPFDEDRYNAVLDVCCLRPDLALWDGGDHEVIGERGVNLSGGQKSRVALARACYVDADLYLLDDPLSAVDVRVGRVLFQECICGFLASKTRILVTHQLQFIRAADTIAVMSAGTLLMQGTPVELAAAIAASMTSTPSPPASSHGGGDGPSGHDGADLSAVGAALAAVLTGGAVEDGEEEEEGGGGPEDGDVHGLVPLTTRRDSASIPGSGGDGNDATGMADGDAPSRSRRGSTMDAASVLRALSSATRTRADAAGERGAHVHVHVPSTGADTMPGGASVCSPAPPSPNMDGGPHSDSLPPGHVSSPLSMTVTAHLLTAKAPGTTVDAGSIQRAQPQHVVGGAAGVGGKEHTGADAVRAGTYWAYCSAAGGVWQALVQLVSLGAAAALSTYLYVWMAQWGQADPQSQRTARYPIVYGAVAAASVVAAVWRSIIFFLATTTASRNLHNRAFSHVLQAPLTYFDTTPSGAILNRFSKDLTYVDELLPMTLFDLLATTAQLLAILGLVFGVNPIILTTLLPIAVAFVWLRAYYLATGRVVKRLESASRSPIFTNFAEAAAGLPTIRSFRLQSIMAQRYRQAADGNMRAYFVYLITSRWMGLRMDGLCWVLLVVTAFVCVAVRDRLPATLVGLSLSQILSVAGAFQWAVRQSAEVENQMISVERLMELTRLTAEDVDITPDSPRTMAAMKAWPSAGHMQLRHVCMRYRPDLPLVLRDVTCDVPGGWKVGVVGRTGAGKSSLFLALLRLVEPQRTSTGGTGIVVDGCDVATLPLTALRRSMSIIPQDPILFSGTLRSNLDPFNQYTDDACLSALARVQLTQWAQAHGGLALPVTTGGGNMSVGQRQLVCLARALLRQSRILLVDEATANVDTDTDACLQTAIRTAFRDATVITVAHRLATIIDANLVVVMDHGRVAECGNPHDLLRVEGGHFRRLVEETGPRTMEVLRREAAAAHAARQAAAAAPSVPTASSPATPS